jgi:hypothetical protein
MRPFTEPPAAASVPDWLCGLWRRRSIRFADGHHDDTTVVYWLQTPSAFADIRIPADRPPVGERDGLDQLTDGELLALTRQAGFAGWTELSGTRCRWHRQIDYQPPSGLPDEGLLHRGDGVLVEEGVHEPYLEIWEAVPCGAAPSPAALAPAQRAAASARGRLVTLGNVFLFARDRRPPLAGAANLAALLPDGRPHRPTLLDLLDCELSFGRCRGGSVPWEISLSTLPHRQGQSLLETDRPS